MTAPTPHAEGEGLLREAIAEWTPELERARIRLCEQIVDAEDMDAALRQETEAALTILGDIVTRGQAALALRTPPAPEREGDRAALSAVRRLCVARPGVSWIATIADIERLEIELGYREAHTEMERLWVEQSEYRAALKAPPALAEGERGADRHGLYVASKTTHAEMWRQRRAAGEPIISTWIDEAGQGETACFADLWTRCIGEAMAAKAVIFYHQHVDRPLKGALVEVGAALAAGIPVFVVSDAAPLLGSFTNHPLITVVHSLDAAFLRAALLAPPAAPKGEQGAVGAAEAEVGRWVYHRIERLMDAKPGTPEGDELAFLAAVAEHVEEYGEEACGDHPLADLPPKAESAPSAGELTRLRAQIEAQDGRKGVQRWSRLTPTEALSVIDAASAAPALQAERDKARKHLNSEFHARKKAETQRDAALAELEEVKAALDGSWVETGSGWLKVHAAADSKRLAAILSALSSAKGVGG